MEAKTIWGSINLKLQTVKSCLTKQLTPIKHQHQLHLFIYAGKGPIESRDLDPNKPKRYSTMKRTAKKPDKSPHHSRHLMVQIHPKHIIFVQSVAQTLSALELLTVSLAGGPQSYSTRRGLYTKEGSKAKGLGSG